jgi:hypothetical protein
MNDDVRGIREVNDGHLRRFAESDLVTLVRSPGLPAEMKQRVLDLLQPWSDTFQRVVTLRVACERDAELRYLAQEHLAEELNHNVLLARSRGDAGSGAWDPVVAAASSWVVDRMFSASGIERVVLAHLVLEGSGMVFHQAGKTAYHDSDYFAVHDEADEEHLEMGYRLLQERTDWQVHEVVRTLDQGWEMITLLCDRVARQVATERGLAPEPA